MNSCKRLQEFRLLLERIDAEMPLKPNGDSLFGEDPVKCSGLIHGKSLRKVARGE